MSTDSYDPWPGVRDYLGDREITAQSLADILQGQVFEALLSPRSPQGPIEFVNVPLWAFDLMVQALKAPLAKRKQRKTTARSLPQALATDMEEFRGELILAICDRTFSEIALTTIEIAFAEANLIIQALEAAHQGRRGRPSVSWLEHITYDVAISKARGRRSDLVHFGMPFDIAQEQAAMQVHKSYPMRSIERILRDLEKADTGEPFRT